MDWFWYFFLYSFLGWVLEVAFARATLAQQRRRKCLRLLPLCPVYGLGALAILALPGWVQASPLWLVLLGGAAATGAEWLMAVFYENALGVSFWDYSAIPGNWQGRVCPPFSLAWGVLALGLVRWVHPVVGTAAAAIPRPVGAAALAAVLADGVHSAALLRRTGDIDSLRWGGWSEELGGRR